MRLPRMQQAIAAGYEAFQAAVFDAGQARGLSVPIGALDADLVRAMAEAGAKPAVAPIVAGDSQVLQALQAPPGARVGAALASLPEILGNPRAVLLDRAHGALLYVGDTAAGRAVSRAAVVVSYRLAGDGAPAANSLRSVTTDLAQIRADVEAGRIVLLRGALD
jgi:hypothetical protein